MIIDIKETPIKILLFLVVFYPSLFGYLSLSNGQILYLGIIYLILSLLYLFIPLKRIEIKITSIISLFIVQSIIYLITLTFSSINGLTTTKDFFEPCRPLLYMTFFMVPLLIPNVPFKSVTYLRNCLIISSIFDLLKFIPGCYPLIKLYSPFEFNSINYIRFSGTFGFCYNFGFVLLFFFIHTLISKQHNKTILTILFSVLILLTGSRSIIAAFFFLISIYLIFIIKGGIRKLYYILFTLILFSSLYLIIKEIESPITQATLLYVERLIDALTGNGGDASLDTRQNQLSLALSYLSKNYLFGIGSMKDSNEPIEMLFGYYLSSWGIIGTLIYLFILLTFLNISLKCFNGEKSIKNFSIANFLWILTIPLAGMSSPITDQIRVFNIFYFIQGIQLSFYIKLKHEKLNKEQNNSNPINK